MSNQVSKSNGSLPAEIGNIAAGLAAAAAGAGSGGGGYMQFTKFGEWLHGREQTEVEEGSRWAINPLTLQHGWIGWGTKEHGTEGEKLGEVMGNAAQPHPAQPDPIEGEWNQQVALEMACLDGEDEGVQVTYNTSSTGGKNAWSSVTREIAKRASEGNPEVVPIVTLESDSYQHRTYGKIFTPVLTIVGWSTLDATAPPAPETEAKDDPEPAKGEEKEEKEEKPTRRRRRRSAE